MDLIIVTRHAGRVTGRPLSSTTREVLRKSPVPVLVLNDAAETGADRVGYQRILACSDLSSDSEHGLREARSLADLFDAELHVVNGYATPQWIQLVDASDMAAGGMPWHALALKRRWHAALQRWVAGVNVGTLALHVRAGADPADAVIATLRAADEEGAGFDLVTIPTHGKGAVAERFFGSTTDAVIRRSEVPVLVYPRHWLHRATRMHVTPF